VSGLRVSGCKVSGGGGGVRQETLWVEDAGVYSVWARGVKVKVVLMKCPMRCQRRCQGRGCTYRTSGEKVSVEKVSVEKVSGYMRYD
jgi:hypothetical protein